MRSARAFCGATSRASKTATLFPHWTPSPRSLPALDLPLSQFFSEDPIKEVPGVSLSADEIRFLTQVQRYSANLTESDRRLLLAMVRKFAATASTSVF